eukprot:scaffold28582_cov29-Prasinocladus_malaysianus.AAC.1
MAGLQPKATHEARQCDCRRVPQRVPHQDLGTRQGQGVHVPRSNLIMHKHVKEREIDVVAATTTFQYAAGIPPGEFRFDQGFVSLEEDVKGNTGLERSLLHLAYNGDAMEILDTPVGRAVLDYKWVTYGKRAYYYGMRFPLIMILLTTLQSLA